MQTEQQLENDLLLVRLSPREGVASASYKPVADLANFGILSGANITDPRLEASRVFSLKPGSATLRLEETVENTGAEEVEFLWNQEVAISGSFALNGCEIQAPASSYFDPREEPILRMRWPFLADGTDISRVPPQPVDAEASFYLCDFTHGSCVVKSVLTNIAVELRWDAALFPFCWRRYGNGPLVLLPASGLPNAAEEGHGLASIPPGGKLTAWLEVEIKEPRA